MKKNQSVGSKNNTGFRHTLIQDAQCCWDPISVLWICFLLCWCQPQADSVHGRKMVAQIIQFYLCREYLFPKSCKKGLTIESLAGLGHMPNSEAITMFTGTECIAGQTWFQGLELVLLKSHALRGEQWLLKETLFRGSRTRYRAINTIGVHCMLLL